MRFTVTRDAQKFRKELEQLLEGMRDLFEHSKGVFFSVKDAGEIGVALFQPFIDADVDEYGKRGGEAAEILFADYYAAKALAFGMAGRTSQGQSYLDKARQRRRGGRFDEWCQTYYK